MTNVPVTASPAAPVAVATPVASPAVTPPPVTPPVPAAADAAAKTAAAPAASPTVLAQAPAPSVPVAEVGVPKLIQALRSGQFPTLEQALADKADFLMSFKYALGLIVPKTSWQEYEPKMDEVLSKLYGFLTLLPAQMQISKQIREFIKPKTEAVKVAAEPAKATVVEAAVQPSPTVNAQVTEPVVKREEPAKADDKSNNKLEPWWKQIGKLFLGAITPPVNSQEQEAVKA